MADQGNKHLQQVLRDIVLLPEAKRGAAAAQGKRVLGGEGEYRFDGKGGKGGNGGNDGGGNGGDKPDKPDDKKNGDPPFDPKDTPDVGDDGSGIGPFYPCDGNGGCVNIRLNGMARPPDGWLDACTPPDADAATFRIYKASAYYATWGNGKEFRLPKDSWYPNLQAAKDAIRNFIPAGQDMGNNDVYAPLATPYNAEYETYSAGGYYKQNDPQSGAWTKGSPFSYQYGISTHDCVPESQYAPCMQVGKLRYGWPRDTCSEVVATADGFRPACEERDPNLPPNMRGDYTAFTLCDADGNPVTVSKDELRGGWTVEHPNYTAYINKDLRVQHVHRKNP